MKFSANLGFLWADRPLAEGIRAAAAAGFDAVECHWPYDQPRDDVIAALSETGLPMLGLNTVRGDVDAGENGLAALPGREEEARAAIDQALDWAGALGAGAVHVMAGKAEGDAAREVFVGNLRYACTAAAPLGVTILIEPLNSYDAPGYFLRTTNQALDIMDQVGTETVKLMFDCYHVQLMEGDLTHRLSHLLPRIGHIQFASVPERARPDRGELRYDHLFRHIAGLGYDLPLGAEYKPDGATEDSLGWLSRWRQTGTLG